MCERAYRRSDAGRGGQTGHLLDLFHQFVLEALAARGHDRHSGMDDVIDVARCEIFDHGHDGSGTLLEILTVPMLDIGGRAHIENAVGANR